MSHTIPRRDILKTFCCDGRNRKANEFIHDLVHEIRLPGGILFPDLCAHSLPGNMQTSEMSDDPVQVLINNKIKELLPRMRKENAYVFGEIILWFAINTMVCLKEPEEIVLVFHTHCGAAESMNMSEDEVFAKMLFWKRQISDMYPHIPVRILREAYSVCGESHFGHTEMLETT